VIEKDKILSGPSDYGRLFFTIIDSRQEHNRLQIQEQSVVPELNPFL
jgi:hypothetical protein